jgi:hypothetical protein
MTPTTDATNGGGLIVEVFDAATGHSLTGWLGMTFAQLAPTPTAGLPPAGETIDFGVLNGFLSNGTAESFSSFVSSEVSSGGSLGALQFAVFAGQAIGGGAHTLETTVATTAAPSQNQVASSLGKLAQGMGILTNANNCNTVNPCLALTSTDPGYSVASLGPNFGGQFGSTVSGALGSKLDFFQYAAGTGTSSIIKATPTAYVVNGASAYFTVGTNGDTQYVVPGPSGPPVPLPATAWLLGSGLLGLLGVGRRNRAAA